MTADQQTTALDRIADALEQIAEQGKPSAPISVGWINGGHIGEGDLGQVIHALRQQREASAASTRRAFQAAEVQILNLEETTRAIGGSYRGSEPEHTDAWFASELAEIRDLGRKFADRFRQTHQEHPVLTDEHQHVGLEPLDVGVVGHAGASVDDRLAGVVRGRDGFDEVGEVDVHGDSSRCAGADTPAERSVEVAADGAAGPVGAPLVPGRTTAGGAE